MITEEERRYSQKYARQRGLCPGLRVSFHDWSTGSVRPGTLLTVPGHTTSGYVSRGPYSRIDVDDSYEIAMVALGDITATYGPDITDQFALENWLASDGPAAP